MGQTCYEKSLTFTIAASPNSPAVPTDIDIMTRLFPAAWLEQPPAPLPYAQYPLFAAAMPNITQFSVTMTLAESVQQGHVYFQSRSWTGSSYTGVFWLTLNPGPGTPTTSGDFTQGSFSTGSQLHSALTVSNFDAIPHSVFVDVKLYCSSPTAPNTPCCPPDPLVSNYLNQILNLEQLIYQKLATATASNTYKLGTRHSGLTGAGTLTVDSLFGVLLEVTSGIPTTPELPGVPPYQWSVGWVSMLTGDGMIDEIRLTRQAQVWAPRIAPFATQVGYQLNAGFTADLVELLPV